VPVFAIRDAKKSVNSIPGLGSKVTVLMVTNYEAIGLLYFPLLSIKGSLVKKKKRPAQLSRPLFTSSHILTKPAGLFKPGHPSHVSFSTLYI